jgi:hypothetical protein
MMPCIPLLLPSQATNLLGLDLDITLGDIYHAYNYSSSY